MRFLAVASIAILAAACEAPAETSDVETVEEVATDTSGVTMENYGKLETGMSYEEVVAILGEPGEEISSNEIGGIKNAMYMWEADSFGGNMNAMFQNGELIQKSQFGLD